MLHTMTLFGMGPSQTSMSLGSMTGARQAVIFQGCIFAVANYVALFVLQRFGVQVFLRKVYALTNLLQPTRKKIALFIVSL